MVSRASFYRWLRPNVPTPPQVCHDLLDAHVVRVFTREKGMAGRDQITTILGQEGVSFACSTVGSILTGRGLRSVHMREVRSNACRRKAMSYARMSEGQRILADQVSALLADADAIDVAEDAREEGDDVAQNLAVAPKAQCNFTDPDARIMKTADEYCCRC